MSKNFRTDEHEHEKHKVLFVMDNMIGGGVQRSLIDLLKYIPRDRFDVTVMLIEKRGTFLTQLPDDIKVCEMDISNKLRNEILHRNGTKRKIVQLFKNGKALSALKSLYRRLILADQMEKYSVPFADVKIVEERYDVAVCYHIHCFFLIRYVAEKVLSTKKICWAHNDFSTTKFRLAHFKNDLKIFDRIYCVSKQIADEAIAIIPEFKAKIRIFHNIIDIKQIRDKSLLFIPPEVKSGQRMILSVGRLNNQKGVDLADRINRSGLADKVKLLGLKENPYPYYKACHIYVQSSRHEGRGIALDEARVLNCAIISTNVAGVKEQLRDRETGSIVTFDKEQLKNAIQELLNSPELVEKYRKNTEKKNSKDLIKSRWGTF